MQRLRLLEVAVGERVERDADHLLGPLAHVLERVEDRLAADVEAAHQLRQLRDGDAVVGHPLEVEVDAQHREHEPQVARDRRLPREQRLHALLDREVAAVDLVVEADHLVGELVVAARERVQRRAQRAEDEVALLLERRLELLELVLERRLSSEPPGDVALGALVGGLGEDLLGRVVLDEDAVAAAVLLDLEAEERGHLGDARGLLHVVRDDHERVVAASARASGPRSPASRSGRGRRRARRAGSTSGSTAIARAMQSRCC